jgi:hypothetical protein
MESNAIKELLYGGVSELMKNSDYYRSSPVGWEFCRFTDAGIAALIQFMNLISVQMLTAQSLELDARAKKLVIDGLKAN